MQARISDEYASIMSIVDMSISKLHHSLFRFLIHLCCCIFRSLTAKGLKTPLWNDPISLASAFKFLDDTCSYIRELQTVDGKPITQCPRRMWSIGYCSNSVSLQLLIGDLFKTSTGWTFFLTYKVCQDPLEHFFGEVRQRGGYNNNPNVEQFR